MVILGLGLRTARAISTHADHCLSVAWRAPSRRLPLSGIGPANDIPIARRRVARRQAEQFFERRMPVKAAVVAKDEFVEICNQSRMAVLQSLRKASHGCVERQ
jgi:hypothetical protein